MTIDIQSNSLIIKEDLLESIKNKVSKLDHFYENIVDATVYLHEENIEKQIEIKLTVKDSSLFVKEKGGTFQEALDLSLDVMKRQIVKYKEKNQKI